MNDGNGGANYTVGTPTNTTGVITPAPLTVTTSDVTRGYDGTLAALGTAVVSGGTLYRNVSNGNVFDSLSGGTFAYTDKNFGLGNKTVTTSGVTVNDGNGGGNYNVSYVSNTTSTINKANLTLTAQTNSKTYDGTLTAAAAPLVSGLFAGDTVTGLAETYDTANAGSGKTLSVSAYTLNDGNGGANYAVATQTNATGVINRAPLTVIIDDQSKLLGAADPLLTYRISGPGLIGTDTLSGSLTRAPGETLAGNPYAITQGSLFNNNYNIMATTAYLVIKSPALPQQPPQPIPPLDASAMTNEVWQSLLGKNDVFLLDPYGSSRIDLRAGFAFGQIVPESDRGVPRAPQPQPQLFEETVWRTDVLFARTRSGEF